MKAPLTFALVVLATGCTTMSAPVPTGPDSFMISAHGVVGNGSGAGQKAEAITAANAHCASLGRKTVLGESATVEPMFGRPPSAEVHYRCL